MGWQNFTGGIAALERPRAANIPTDRTIPRPFLGPMISIIIPAHNEEAYLGQTLEGLQDQIYPNYEIIVVANGCTDRTAEIARDRCHRLINVPERGLSRARNLGAEAARGDILVFLDADTVLDKDALDTIATRFTREFAAGTLRGEPDIPRLKYQIMYA